MILLCTAWIGTAQEEDAIAKALESAPAMEVKTDLLKFNKETQNGFSSVLNCPVSDAEKKWKDFLETKYQAEVKKTKGGLITENTTMADVAKAPLTVTALFSEDEEGCKMDVFYNMSGYYLNPDDHAKETMAASASLKEYQKQLYVSVYQSVLDDQRKAKDKSQKELDKLVKEGEKLDKEVAKEEADVNKAEETIIESEQKIVDLQAKIESLRGEIEQSKATAEELREAKAKKDREVAEQQEVVKDKEGQISRIKAAATKVGM